MARRATIRGPPIGAPRKGEDDPKKDSEIDSPTEAANYGGNVTAS
jgi:hypothetical protein